MREAVWLVGLPFEFNVQAHCVDDLKDDLAFKLLLPLPGDGT